MEQKNDALLPCQKETALENIESCMNLYDMPEHQDTLAVEGWALSELVDEVKRWRATHNAGEFSPDYCAAREALAEHLEHCTRPTPAPLSKGDAVEALRELNSIAEALDERGMKIAAKNMRHAITSLTPSPVAVDAKPTAMTGEGEKLATLLAYIHRDGGQYTQEHGLEKAFSDAVNIVCEWRDRPALTAPKPDSKQVKGLVEALEDAKTSMLDSGYAADCTSIKKINEALKTFKGEA